MTSDEARAMKAGDPHYTAYVGPPWQYDFMGATQFRLLCSLGLRAHHTLLDFGCGSLRAGRLFLPYLEPGNYFGIEPNPHLIDEGFAHELGEDLRRIKQPQFAYVEDFTVPFDSEFDFIVAQSIFSHTGEDLIARALPNLRAALSPHGLLLATFVEGRSDHKGGDWVYPGVVTFRRKTIRRLIREAGLHGTRLPWYHPRQTWYLMARDPARLPGALQRRHLRGAVLYDPEFAESRSVLRRLETRARRLAGRILPRSVKNALKRMLGISQPAA